MKDFFAQGLKVHDAILHDVTSVDIRSAYETEQARPSSNVSVTVEL